MQKTPNEYLHQHSKHIDVTYIEGTPLQSAVQSVNLATNWSFII